MNNKIDSEMRNAFLWTQENNIRLLKGGAWFAFNAEGTAIAADIIGAVLLMHDKVPAGFASDINNLVNSGFAKEAAAILSVDGSWLHRFFMGYDRGYQVLLIGEKDKEFKDEVSAYGISLAKEFFKKKQL